MRPQAVKTRYLDHRPAEFLMGVVLAVLVGCALAFVLIVGGEYVAGELAKWR